MKISKNITAILLSFIMIFSLYSSIFASENSTTVTYIGEGKEDYTLTVPSSLTPNTSENIILEGTWPSNRMVIVSAPSSITLTNDIDGQTKNIAVNFNDISKKGDNLTSLSFTESISVGTIDNVLFGTWTGTINYTINIIDTELTDSIPLTSLTVPTQSNILIYTGNVQSPSWNNYDSSQLTISGTTSSTNAGTYTATFTPKTGYQWSDGTTTTKSVSWTINKADNPIFLDSTSGIIPLYSCYSEEYDEVWADGYINFKVNNPFGAELTVNWDGPAIYAEISENTVTAYPTEIVREGKIMGIITITSSETTNYYSNSVEYTVIAGSTTNNGIC